MLVGRVSNGNLGTGRRLQDLPDMQHRRPGQVDAPSKPHAQAAAMASLIDGQRDGMQNAATEARAIARFVFRQGRCKMTVLQCRLPQLGLHATHGRPQ